MGTSCALRTPFSCTIRILVGKNSLYILPTGLATISRKYPLFSFQAVPVGELSKMSSQESVEESRVSHPTPGPGANSDADHFGPSTEEDMEADLKRIDAMEEDQEVTSRFRAGFTMGELQSSAIPNSVIPSNVRFLSYTTKKKTHP